MSVWLRALQCGTVKNAQSVARCIGQDKTNTLFFFVSLSKQRYPLWTTNHHCRSPARNHNDSDSSFSSSRQTDRL